jgi:hypothetical protein
MPAAAGFVEDQSWKGKPLHRKQSLDLVNIDAYRRVKTVVWAPESVKLNGENIQLDHVVV